MSQINQLIEELCPEGVEYRALGLLCVSLKKGTLTQSQLLSEGKYPVMNSGRTFYGWFDDYNNDSNAIVIASRGEYAGYISFINQPFWAGGLCYPYRSKDETVVSTKFLYYALKNEEHFIMGTLVARGSIPALNKQDIDKLQLPIPPLPVQEEIVRILDTFTELETELEAELEARQQQYEFYKSSLFPSLKDGNVQWCELGDVGLVTKLAGFEFTKYVSYSDSGDIIALRGLNVKDGHLVLDDVKYIDNSNLEMLTRSKLKKLDMLFTYVGTVGQVAMIDIDDKYYLAPNVAKVRISDDRFDPEYVMYYFLTAKFKSEQVEKLLQASSMQNIPMGKIRQFKLPMVSKEHQQKVVSILGKFNTICNDISEGLPAEIEARRKQYEYYRDKLLTFKPLSIEGVA